MASSSSSVTLESKYDVFLSFRGEDTRHNFTAHLYAALCRENIAAFIDDDGLKTGDEISPVLLKAIQDSKISVIIFSKDYASSRWCLEELEKILQCRKSGGQIVVPVFYHIDPSEVRHQIGSFKEGFDKNDARFKNMPERVQMWRDALTEAANISGKHSTENRSESELVEEIVGDILKKLTDMSPLSDNCDDIVGIDRRIAKINSLLKTSNIIGIWGMGGIGKTTLVEVLFKRISRDFDSCCFINVTKQLEKHHDNLVDLQQEIISRILGEGKNFIEIPNAIPQLTKERLRRRKFLVVLDDVNNFEDLEFLIMGLQPLHVKSRIIVTTRDKQVLSCCEENHIYEVEGLNYSEAPLLFYKYAFKENHAPKHFQQLSKMIIAYAKGHPLALKVLGSLLHRKSKEAWESVVLKLKEIVDPKILDVLKISYNGLNSSEKNMFLDIACFLNWEREHVAKKILKTCYEHMEYCLEVLINKALIKISNKMLHIHDLLQEMGREIVRKECEYNPGKRSRLWDEDDILHVLQNNKGTDRVKGIFLDMSGLRKEIHLSPKAFVKMANLKVLKLYWSGSYYKDCTSISKLRLPSVLDDLPNKLRYLHWDGYPWDELPSKFSAEKLVELKLPGSKIQKLWDEAKHVVDLKAIDVSNSKRITEFPNLQDAPKLESLIFEGCKRLYKFPSYISCFTNLGFLNMRGCQYLRRFPRNIHFQSPITLDFNSCINLTEFPEVSGNVKHLNLKWTAIEEIPASIESLTKLVTLTMYGCKDLKCISPNICKLSSLSELNLVHCLKLESFPEIMEEMKCLKRLDLSGTAIKELPSSIDHLVGLTRLGFSKCKNLKGIPTSISTSISDSELLLFEYLIAATLALSQLPSSLCLSLEHLDLSGHDFESLPTSIKQLSRLRTLDLSNCNMLQSIPELPLRIECLDVNNCKKLRWLPQLPSDVKQCDEKKSTSSLCVRFPRNVKFSFNNCVNLMESISKKRVEHMAIALWHFYKEMPGFRISLPGSEVPEWFNSVSFGHSITIEQPQQYCGNTSFIGFALCAVITVEMDHCRTLGAYNVCYNCYGINGKESVRVGYFSPTCGLIESNHIAIFFIPAKDMMLLDGHYTTVIFDFDISGVKMPMSQEFVQLNCCGVSPIYEEPNMQSAALMLRDFLQEDEDDSSSDEEVEIMSDEDDRSSDKEVETMSDGDDRLSDEEVKTMSDEDDRWSDEEVKTMSDEDDRSRDEEMETRSREDDKSSDKQVELHPKRNCIDQINSSIMGGLFLPHVGLLQPKECTYGSPAEGCQVECCRVHPLNAESNVSQPTAYNEPFAASSEDLDETISKDSSKRKFHELTTSGSEICKSNEEVESHPKRICKNQINSSLTEKFLSSIKSGLSTLFRRT